MKKREPKERIIYTNVYDEETFSYYKQCLEEDSANPVSEDEVWKEYYFNLDCQWEDEKSNLKSFFDNGIFLVKGTVGRWDGNHDAGKVVDSFSSLSNSWNDCDNIKLYDVNGHFFIKGYHHDGENLFEVKKLTPKGINFFKSHEYDTYPKELHSKLWDCSSYTVLPNYAHKIYGCPKRESA